MSLTELKIVLDTDLKNWFDDACRMGTFKEDAITPSLIVGAYLSKLKELNDLDPLNILPDLIYDKTPLDVVVEPIKVVALVERCIELKLGKPSDNGVALGFHAKKMVPHLRLTEDNKKWYDGYTVWTYYCTLELDEMIIDWFNKNEKPKNNIVIEEDDCKDFWNNVVNKITIPSIKELLSQQFYLKKYDKNSIKIVAKSKPLYQQNRDKLKALLSPILSSIYGYEIAMYIDFET